MCQMVPALCNKSDSGEQKKFLCYEFEVIVEQYLKECHKDDIFLDNA